MTVGIIMLVHRDLNRAEEVARFWSASGCPVIIHVDGRVGRNSYDALVKAVAPLPRVRFCDRQTCVWGKWSIVAATQVAAGQMLAQFPEVNHVYLTSGACLPVRSARSLVKHLEQHQNIDFIESATTSEVPWIVGGLSDARFDLHFPFAWKKNRWLFDSYVRLQRALGVKRRIPEGLVPHLGSQWWCLTRRTLSAILSDPRRPTYDRYFKRTWIPDESYFQTLARKHSGQIESRSLTLSHFDCQGKPHVFYDDHADLLRRSNCFVARKVWPHADRLYDTFLSDQPHVNVAPDLTYNGPYHILSASAERRTMGRPGLCMQSRWPRANRSETAAPYAVLQGFTGLYDNFETWLSLTTGAEVHGHLFAPDRVGFASGQTGTYGGLSDTAAIRDYNPGDFLTNLIWNARHKRQCFQFGPADNQSIAEKIVMDPNARVCVIAGAWAVPLFKSGAAVKELRPQAARLQQTETALLALLRKTSNRATIKIRTLAEVTKDPFAPLHDALHATGKTVPPEGIVLPHPVDLKGFGAFLTALRNEGMHPYVVGNYPAEETRPRVPSVQPRTIYMVR